MTLLNRYIGGEHKAVWAELLAGVDKDRQPIADADAEAVASETMRRVRANIETIAARLSATGYEFGVYPDGEPIPFSVATLGDTDAADDKTRAFTQLVGALPLSLRAFYRHVGGVCLAGRYGDGETWQGADALWVEPLDTDYIAEQFADWENNVAEYGAEEMGAFMFEFAPDDLHKDNISGGAPYGIELPQGAADAFVANEWHGTTFVDYLRICFRWGGFPGFAREGSMPPQIAVLRESLLPI
ncbi:MAG: hypothetical protein H7Y38_16380 [Armatimonadetes bacterium]|nr:hypothetical protein [Armatimonadota bacterium]